MNDWPIALMCAYSFKNTNCVQKDENVNIVIYENEFYEIDAKNEHIYNKDLTNDYFQNKLVEHKNTIIDLFAKAHFVIYYDRTYSYRKYVSPLLYIAALTNTIVLFDEQSDYEQYIVKHIYKDNEDLIKYVTITETNCKEKKKAVLSNKSLMKRLTRVQKEWYEMAENNKLPIYIK